MTDNRFRQTDRQTDRHAYLVMAHGNFSVLEKCLSLLDDPRNDIYLHIDRKTKEVPFDRLKQSVCQARLTIVSRIPVNWGGYSQIEAELLLLSTAAAEYHSRYHLISGADLPLKTQDEMHDFFSRHRTEEYIRFDSNITEDRIRERIRYYYLLQDRIGRNSGIAAAVLEQAENMILKVQKTLQIDRTKNNVPLYKGTNWFSITQELADYVLSQSDEVRRRYRYTLCADEVFLQTIVGNSKFMERAADTSLRCIDWKRGAPYTFTIEDYDMLMNSGKFFARKFDEKVDMEIVNRIYAELMQRQGHQRP